MDCSVGVCTPTAKGAVLNVGDLEALLASGDVTVKTTGTGVEARNIEVKSLLSWTASSMLAFDSYDSISVNKTISIAGAGGMSLATNDGGGGGMLLFGGKGNISFTNLSSALIIDGQAYTLVGDIKTLAADVAANPAGFYALGNDYDASQDGAYSTAPVATTLTGVVEGLGNAIVNLTIKRSQGKGPHIFIGLFTQVAYGGAVDSVLLRKLDYEVAGDKAAASMGGLIGVNNGLVFDDRVDGALKASHLIVGGLVGANNDTGAISLSSADVRVSGAFRATTYRYAGGLVGENLGIISSSWASGNVKAADGSYAGGLVGFNTGSSGIEMISDSFAIGTVTAGDQSITGGLVGLNEANADINNSYAMGAVSAGGNSYVGGFVGSTGNGSDGTVEESYSTGAVSGGSGSHVGGFAGAGNNGTVDFTDCYWDTTTSGTNDGIDNGNGSGITGLTTEEFQSGLPDGFNPNTWAEDTNINNGLPFLIANPPPK